MDDPEPSGDPSGEQAAGQSKGTETTHYVVYEAAGKQSAKTKAFAALAAIWQGEAADEAAARWAAVDADTDRTARSQGTGDELHLLALPVSRAVPKLTKLTPEQIAEQLRKVRK
jgi:hypothetical protein